MTSGSYQTLLVRTHPQWVEIFLNRPKSRNAMSFEMVEELQALFSSFDEQVQAVVLRGVGGHFCAGGDVKDMAGMLQQPQSTLAQANRKFGLLLEQLQSCPQLLIVVLEGAVMGGGFGLACISDVAFALPSARFGLPEVTLGVTPAQIAPFVVARIGLTQARRLALTGARIKADEALHLGLIHECCPDEVTLLDRLQNTLESVSRCAPDARKETKKLLLAVGAPDLGTILDQASEHFASAAQGKEGKSGMMAFISKRPPEWQSAWGTINIPPTPE